MNRNLLLTIFFLTATCTFSLAQPSWQWGRGDHVTRGEGYPVTTDRFGNVFAVHIDYGAYSDTGIVSFGSVSGPAKTAGIMQSVWVKFDSAGTPIWAGGNTGGFAKVTGITTDHTGNLIVYGSFHDSLIIGSHHIAIGNYYSYFIAKVDLSGSVLWVAHDAASTFIGPGHVTTDSADNIYITGTITDSPGTVTTIGADTMHHVVYAAKYLPSGTPAWASSIATDMAIGIAVTSGGAVYICGNFQAPSVTIGSSVIYDPYMFSNCYLAEFSPAGIPIWAEAATGSDASYAFDLAKDDFDNLYLTGYYADTSITFGTITATSPYPAWGYGVLYLFKFSPAHLALWGKSIASHSESVIGWSVATSSCASQVWVTGRFVAPVNIDGHILSPPTGSPDPCFIAGYNTSGTLAGYTCLRSGSDDFSGIACDRSGNVFVSGDYETGNIVIGPDTLRGANPIDEYMFVAKYGFPSDTMYTHNDSTICGSGSLTLTAPMGYTGYFWNDSEATQNRTVSGPGNYRVYCTVCNHVLIDTFHVVNGIDSIFSRRDTSVCVLAEHPVLLIIAPFGGSGYHWSNGDTLTTDSIYTAGIYWVNYHLGCTFYSDTINVIFNFLPSPITGKDTICIGNLTTLHDATTGGIWSSSNTAVATVGTSGIVSGISSGTATITYSTGCFVTKNITVVSPPCVNYLPEPEAAGNTVELYPIPASGNLTIKADEHIFNSFSITNSIGQLLAFYRMDTPEIPIDVSMFPPGLYVLQMHDKQGQEHRFKFVINR